MQSGVMRVMRDQAATLPVALYSMRNIVKGSLSINYLMPTADTADAVDVGYFDSSVWAPRRVRATLPGSAAAKPAKIDLFGVVGRQQAFREGLYQAAANRYRRKVITFATEMEGFIPSFGDLIAIQHDMPAWGQGGEVVAWVSGTRTATLSEPAVFTSGTHYIALRKRDGSVDGPYAVTAGAGANDVVLASAPVITPYTGGSEERTHYAFGPAEAWQQPARVISVRPGSLTQVQIEAVNEDANVHLADVGQTAPAAQYSQLNAALINAPQVSGLLVRAVTPDTFTASWQASPYADHYLVEQSPDAVTWQRTAETTATGLTQSARFGVATKIRVAAVGLALGAWTQLDFGDVLRAPLPSVTGLAVIFRDATPWLIWNDVTDLPRTGIGYEIRKGANWATGEIIGRTMTSEIQALGSGTYWVKAWWGAAWSAVESGIVATGALAGNVIATWDEEATGWSGARSASVAISGTDIVLSGGGTFSAIPLLSAEPSIYWYGGIATSGTYDIPASHIVDIGSAQPCRVEVAYRAYADNPFALFSELASVAAASSIAGDYSAFADVSIQIAIADAALVYGAWFNYTPGTYVGRAFKARAVLSSSNTSVYAGLDRMTLTVDMPDRLERGENIVIGTGGLDVVYLTQFQVAPNVQITVLNAVSGDVPTVSGQTNAGFTVAVSNGGSGVARNINWIAQGY
jgi:hypothetical protein